MRSKLSAIFVGGVDSSFQNKDGDTIEFRQGRFAIPGEMETPIFSFPKGLDISNLKPMEPAHMVVDFRYNDQYKNFKARVVAIYPTEKALNDADVNVDGFVDSSAYASSQSK